jgi:hypothetical protein
MMKTQILLAHIAPHFHALGAVFFLILLSMIVTVVLIFTSDSKDKDK